MTGAYIIHRDKLYSDRITVVAPYNARYVDAIKSIPPGYRQYDPEYRSWTVFDPYIERAVQIIDQYFDLKEDLQYINLQADEPWRSYGFANRKQSKRDSAEPTTHYSRLGILPTNNRKLIQAAYRILSQLHHPDTGGNATDFKLLTEAYEWALSRANP